MRIPLLAAHIAPLAAILPSYPGETPLVAFPLILPMGWVESPSHLCTVTETIADIVNGLWQEEYQPQGVHRLDVLADSLLPPIPALPDPTTTGTALRAPTVRSRGALQKPLNIVDFYKDDFILMLVR